MQCGGGKCTPNCMDGEVDGTETDIDCGGSCPMGCGVGKKCKIDPDCASNACDMSTFLCVASQCTDGQKDGAETDIDCGGGMCMGCAVGRNCKVDTDCTSMACDANLLQCVGSQCADHQQDGVETDIDCGGTMCSPCPVGKKCKLNADCTTMACDAATFRCDTSQCVDGKQDGMETDLDCGGPVCSPCGVGKGCVANTDCASAACDFVTHKCVASTCVDQRQDGTETGVDCGGGCTGCIVGQGCNGDTDCLSNACDANTLLCVASQCNDHRLDGAETAIDCGGGTCPACAVGQACVSDNDCTTLACDGMTFVCDASQCSDHRQDGNETDVDCGGADSCARCPSGKMCVANSDCQVGHTCNSVTHVCS
jgi:hypothetical protein